MRRAARIDENQPEIITALRGIGALVQSLSAVGGGVPDLLVGYRGRLMVIEVKDGSKPPSERKLTADQVAWHAQWAGYPVHVAESVEQAIATLTRVR